MATKTNKNQADKKSGSKASAFQKKPAAKPVTKVEKVEESKAKAFQQKRNTKIAPLHASKPEPDKPKAKSFSFYPTDFETLEKVQKLLVEYSNRGMSESVVARTALNYLYNQLDSESKKENKSDQFEDNIKRIIQESK